MRNVSAASKTRWAIVTETSYVTKGKGLAWTFDQDEAESCAQSIPGARVVDAEEFVKNFNGDIAPPYGYVDEVG